MQGSIRRCCTTCSSRSTAFAAQATAIDWRCTTAAVATAVPAVLQCLALVGRQQQQQSLQRHVFGHAAVYWPCQLCLGQGGIRAECLLCCVVDHRQPDTLRAEVLATAATRSRSLGFGWWVSEPVAWQVEGCTASDTQVAGLWQPWGWLDV